MHSEIKTLQLIEPFRIAHGTSATRQVLRVSDGNRVAEAPFVPYYGEDSAQTLALLNQTILPAALPRTAALALNLLRHDIVGHATGQKLSARAYSELGPSHHSAPLGCRSFGIPDDLQVFADKVRDIAQQFHVLKLKLGSGDIDLDFGIVSAARDAAPKAKLVLDVNGGWDLHQAAPMIEKLSSFSPALIEQPIHHRHGIEAWEKLRVSLPAHSPPIFADESAQTVADLPALAPYVDGVNIKLLKCGSFDAAIAMISYAREHDLQIMLGCMIETSLGTTAAGHLAPWADWIDLDGHFYVANDDYIGIDYDENGCLLMPDRPGIGAELK